MNKWTKIFTDDYDRNYKSTKMPLVLGDPTPPENLKNFLSTSGFQWPQEFTEVYTYHNGVGLLDKMGEVRWSLYPIDLISKLNSEAVDWFKDTHPEISNKFKFFYDWHNGDYLGYLSETQGKSRMIYEFSHELYAFEASQPWTEFISPMFHSIEEIFNIK